MHDADTLTLTRFRPAPVEPFLPTVVGKMCRGLFVDCETTGLDPAKDRVIQLAAVPFVFAPSGGIVEYGSALVQYNDPGVPISPEIERLTGITDDDVAGKHIRVEEFAMLARQSDIVIAHNAEFDRPFAERVVPAFMDNRWGCSMRDVPWKEWYGTQVLKYLMFEHCRMFFDAHRADADCYAAVHLLATPSDIGAPMTKPVLSHVLEVARKGMMRLYAYDAAYEMKDVLKLERRYTWDAKKSVWWKDFQDRDEAEAEYRWLGEEGCSPAVRKFDARARFTDRVG